MIFLLHLKEQQSPQWKRLQDFFQSFDSQNKQHRKTQT